LYCTVKKLRGIAAVTLGVFFLLATVPAAFGATYTLQFTITNFTPDITGPAPQDPVFGNFVFDKSPSDFSIQSLVSVDLTIAGHSYSLAELDFWTDASTPYQFIGALPSVTGVYAGQDDFSLVYSKSTGAPQAFNYSVTGARAIYQTDEYSTFSMFTFTPGDLTVTPIPPSLALFVSGLGVLGLLALGRKRKTKPSA